MKTKPFSSILRAVAVLLVLVGAMEMVSFAQSANASTSKIVGVWDVQVTLLDCSSGVQVGAFQALHKYELGGTVQAVPATNPAALSSNVGIWSATSKDHYDMTIKMYRFDASGNYAGWNVVRNKVVLSKDGTLYAGAGEAQFFDLNGNVVATACPTFAGTRFK